MTDDGLSLSLLQEAASSKEKELTATHQNLRADQRAKQASRESASDTAVSLRGSEMFGVESWSIESQTLNLYCSSTLSLLLEPQRRIKSRRKKAIDDLEVVPVSQMDDTTGKKEVDEAKKRHEALQAELTSKDFDKELTQKNRAIKSADDEREELTVELNALNRQAEQRAKLHMKKTEVEDKKSGVERL